MKRAFIDADVILRYFTQDPPELAEAARKTFSAAQEGLVVLVLAPITVAEKSSGFSNHFMATPGLRFPKQ